MFEIGWTELLVIGVVALIVIGPKDLPEMFRQLGRFTAKMRSMARDFQRAMDQAANEAGVKDIARDLKNVTSMKSMGLDAVKDAASKFEKWDPIKNAARPSGPAVAAVPPVAANTILGPATQALADAQAAKKAILVEAGEKLRAVGTTPAAVAPAAVTTPAKPPRKPPARKPTAARVDAAPLYPALLDPAPTAKPRAGRKAGATPAEPA